MAGRARRQQAGFTYLGLIVLVTIIGLVGAATLKVGALLQRAGAEYELLEIGAEFSAALRSYALATPKGQPTQPTSLEALLRDPRYPDPRRHLRRIFVDPMTGKAEWGLVAAGEGAPILGVYSLSQAQPLKIANFDSRFINFDNKKHLSDWKFAASGQTVSGTPAAAPDSIAPALAPAPVAEPPAPSDLAPREIETAEPEQADEKAADEPAEPVEEEEENEVSTPASMPVDQ